jgi:hypothetical protein
MEMIEHVEIGMHYTGINNGSFTRAAFLCQSVLPHMIYLYQFIHANRILMSAPMQVNLVVECVYRQVTHVTPAVCVAPLVGRVSTL